MIEAKLDPKDVMWLENIGTRLDAKVLLIGEWEPFITRVVDVVGTYPPDFPGNTYVRTGHLGRSWGTAVESPLSASVFNYALYAGDVHGHTQWAYHAGHGWKNLFTEGSRLLDFLAQKLWEKIERIWTQ